MKKFLPHLTTSLFLLALAPGAVGLAHAADAPTTATQIGEEPAKKPTAQQEKMKACHAKAKTKGLKGDPRKAFMKECLSAK